VDRELQTVDAGPSGDLGFSVNTEARDMTIRASDMVCRVLKRGVAGGTRLMFEGNFDAMSAPVALPMLEEAVRSEPRHVIFDLTKLELVDASGVRALDVLFRASCGGGAFGQVVGLQGQPRTLLQLLRVNELIDGTGRLSPRAQADAEGPPSAGPSAVAA
jgi:anti-anti-sigma regulatory factor